MAYKVPVLPHFLERFLVPILASTVGMPLAFPIETTFVGAIATSRATFVIE